MKNEMKSGTLLASDRNIPGLASPEQDGLLALRLADIHVVVGDRDELPHSRVAGLQRNKVQVQPQASRWNRFAKAHYLRPAAESLIDCVQPLHTNQD
jgi:hypothetical protein